jgi:hypothetical protein
MADARAIFSFKIRKCLNLLLTKGWIFSGTKTKRDTWLTQETYALEFAT